MNEIQHSIQGLLHSGFSMEDIAIHTGLSLATIYNARSGKLLHARTGSKIYQMYYELVPKDTIPSITQPLPQETTHTFHPSSTSVLEAHEILFFYGLCVLLVLISVRHTIRKK